MSVPDSSRTYHANQAVHLTDLINLKFSPERFGTNLPRYIRVREPDGPSTDGGRKARQAILLCRQDDEEASPIICGFIDVPSRRAELRSYPVVKQAYTSRFSAELELSRGEYNRCLDLLQEFLDTQAMETRIVTSPRRPTVDRLTNPPKPAASSTALPLLAVLLAFGFGFLTCYLMMRFQLL